MATKSVKQKARRGLAPKIVHEMADRAGYYPLELKSRERQYMLSFYHDSIYNEGVRVNVYYTTGTVTTCLYHPKQQRKTQIFGRNMNETDLKNILLNPRYHTGRRYHRIAHSHAFVDKAYINPVCEFFFQDRSQVHFMRQLEPDYKDIDTVCIGKSCVLVLFNDGYIDWKGVVPEEIAELLHQRPENLPHPELVALCPTKSNAFFLQLADGHRLWNDVPEKLDALLNESPNVGVDIIALGAGDQYYVKFKDGYEDWWMDDSHLRSHIKYANRNGLEVSSLSLGYSEYAVKFTDNSWRWSSGMNNVIPNCNQIHQIVLGFGDDYVAMFD